jgi:hypothetical protein
VPGPDPVAEAPRARGGGTLVLYAVVEADSASAARELAPADGSIRPEDPVMGPGCTAARAMPTRRDRPPSMSTGPAVDGE